MAALASFNQTVDSLAGRDIFNYMVEQEYHLDRIFHALGDSTRRAMLRRLSRREHTVGELAEPFQISLAAVSKHVKALEQAGLVRRSIRGRSHYCQINPQPLARANGWLQPYERLWTARLTALEAMLRHPDKD